MNFYFQQILKRTGLLMGEIPPIKSGILAVSAARPASNGETGLNCVVTGGERMAFENFRGWIPKKSIQPNPTKKTAWISPAWFKIGMEACNL
jgi:hypothetical protein